MSEGIPHDHYTVVGAPNDILMDIDQLPAWTNGRVGEHEIVLATATVEKLPNERVWEMGNTHSLTSRR